MCSNRPSKVDSSFADSSYSYREVLRKVSVQGFFCLYFGLGVFGSIRFILFGRSTCLELIWNLFFLGLFRRRWWVLVGLRSCYMRGVRMLGLARLCWSVAYLGRDLIHAWSFQGPNSLRTLCSHTGTLTGSVGQPWPHRRASFSSVTFLTFLISYWSLNWLLLLSRLGCEK